MEFDEGSALSLCDRNGFINKENFFDFAVRTNLVDWTDLPKMEKKQAESETRKQQTPSLATRQRHQHRPKGKGLCCCGKRPVSPEDEEDRIVHAFRKMDPNNTGYVSWKEFKKVFIFLENVKRIYFPPNQDSFPIFQPSLFIGNFLN